MLGAKPKKKHILKWNKHNLQFSSVFLIRCNDDHHKVDKLHLNPCKELQPTKKFVDNVEGN
jgi:hypothetical protein